MGKQEEPKKKRPGPESLAVAGPPQEVNWQYVCAYNYVHNDEHSAQLAQLHARFGLANARYKRKLLMHHHKARPDYCG